MTYNDTKRIISYQKGGDVQELTNQFLQRFSDVLPANVTSEQVKLLRYDERFKDHAELENEFKFDDDHKVTVLIKEVQVRCALFLILVAFSVIVCKLIRKLIIPWNFDHNLLSSSTGVFRDLARWGFKMGQEGLVL